MWLAERITITNSVFNSAMQNGKLEEAMRRVRIERRDASGAVVIANPLVNAVAAPVRAVEDIRAADESPEVRAVVIAAEGAAVPEEGVARAGDIVVFWVNGYNRPAWTGGPTHWTEGVGLLQVAAALDAFAAEASEESLRPAPLPKRLAGGAGSFVPREAA
jgi:hypothetical protein